VPDRLYWYSDDRIDALSIHQDSMNTFCLIPRQVSVSLSLEAHTLPIRYPPRLSTVNLFPVRLLLDLQDFPLESQDHVYQELTALSTTFNL